MQVYEGRHGGKAVALKVIRAQKKDEFLQSLAALRTELTFLLSDNIRQHPNIIKVLGFTWQEETGPLRDQGIFIKPILLVELASPESPTLDVLIRNLRIDDFATKASLISDIVQGLDAVQGEFFVHGDLKPENVLIFPFKASSESPEGPKYIAKLSDFGYSDDADVPSTSRRWNLAGTEYWSPPECFISAHGQVDEDTMTAVRANLGTCTLSA
ncbi:kinase-like domain-containing protein [Cladorrhinum sp. PSN332]|nr:kinase-like domain-containing protein [Cladorrhinum sp. PSN332]